MENKCKNERLEKAELGYSNPVDTVISFNPSNTEIRGLLNRYKALRILIAQEPGSGDYQLICISAAIGDHGLLAKWLIEQGYTILKQTFFHVVDSEKGPFLTLDGFYKNDDKLTELLFNEIKSIYDTQNLIEELLSEYSILKMCLPTIVNTEAIDFTINELSHDRES